MLEYAMLIGLGFVAGWVHTRYPRIRPRSLVWAALHVAVSFVGFALLPEILRHVLPLVSSHGARLVVALALLIPALTYVLLSWIWMIARVVELLGGTPRGGQPVSNQ